MFLSGFADEASQDLEQQIAVTKELGWHYIETRDVWNTSLGTMTDEQFETFQSKLAQAGIKISCYGSRIANWSRHPRSQEDFEASKQELLTAIPRMQKLGIPIVRGMSFLNPTDEEPGNPDLEKIIFAKVGELVQICADAGIKYGHENCMNYGGLSFQHTLKLLDAVNNPALTLIFDTGNPCFNLRRLGVPPYPMQSAWEFYRQVRDFISYVHIKDGYAEIDAQTGKVVNPVFTYPGYGCADLRAIFTDLKARGYDGCFSIEPHVVKQFHDESSKQKNEQICCDAYVKYGREAQAILRECGFEQ